MTRSTGRINIIATALDAIHHGAGTSGNTQLLRVQEIVTQDGRRARVPFISGNSIKHMIRDGAVRFALDAMQVPDGSLTKPVVDLLFSGGHLSKSGSSVDLNTARRLSVSFPVLSLCGYSAGNFMTASKLRVDNLHLVCEENNWRVPDGVTPALLAKRAGHYRSEAFGTRHEALRAPHVAKLLEDKTAEAHANAVSAQKGSKTPSKASDSSQMIYDFEVLCAGSELWGGVWFEDLTQAEVTAFRSGLSYACQGVLPDGRFIFRVGAKASVGYGRVAMRFAGKMRDIVTAPTHTDSDSMLPEIARSANEAYSATLREYAEDLLSRRDEIIALLHEACA